MRFAPAMIFDKLLAIVFRARKTAFNLLRIFEGKFSTRKEENKKMFSTALPSETNRQTFRIGSVVIVALALIYLALGIGTVQDHRFAHEDREQILEGISYFQDPGYILQPGYSGRKHPTVSLLLGMLYPRFGWSPFPYHVTLLLFHALNALLVTMFSRSLGLGWMASEISGLFFLILSVHFQAVAWIGNTTRVLMTSFLLLAMCLFVSHRNKPHPIKLGSSWLVFFLATQSSPDAVIFPALVLAYDLLILRRNPLTRKNLSSLGEYGVLALMTIVYILTQFFLYDSLGFVQAAKTGKWLWSKRIVGSLWGVANLAVPRREILQFFLEPTVINRILTPLIFFVIPIAWTASLSQRVLWWKKEMVLLVLFCFAWFAIAFLPFSVLGRDAPWKEFPPSRYFYVPLIGFSFFAGKFSETLFQGTRQIVSVWIRRTVLGGLIIAAVYFYSLNVWTFCFLADKWDRVRGFQKTAPLPTILYQRQSPSLLSYILKKG